MKATRRPKSIRIERELGQIEIGFYTGGESRHLPVALASRAAKLAREKYMLRFNAFFQRHDPGVKATAGYYTDAQRFLKESDGLRRRLGIVDGDFIRAK